MPSVTTYANNLREPRNLAFDSANNLYVVDSHSRRVTKIAVTTLARTDVGGAQNVTGVDVDSAGNVYTCFGDNTQVYKNNAFWASHPLIQSASDLAVDSAGNVYIACAGTNSVVKITP